MKKRILSLILILVLCLSLGITAYADTNEVNQTRQSVVVVRPCLDLKNYGTSYLGWGTGFFVDDGNGSPVYLVTNYHVIQDFILYGAGELISYPIDGIDFEGRAKIHVFYDSEDFEEAYYVSGDPIKDLAILKLVGPTSKRVGLKLMTPSDGMVGSDIWAVGYPGLSDNSFADATTRWGITDATVTKGAISRLFHQSGTGVSEIQIDCDIKHGNSGGPLINDMGSVLGVTTWGVSSSDEGINYAISIEEVMTMMDQLSLTYSRASAVVPAENPEPTPEPVPAKKGLDLTFWLIIAVAAVIVIAAVIIIIALLRSKAKKKAAAEASAAAAAAAAARERELAAQAQAQPQKVAYIRSLAAQHRGSRLQLGSREIVIGRNRDCAIAFKDGTPGVSGRHCSLRWDASSRDFVLTDLNSSYGTFLLSGQKLTPNVPYHVSAGEQFYLGDDSNMLRVELE